MTILLPLGRCPDLLTLPVLHQGEEDYNVAMQHGVISTTLLPPNPVDASGCFTNEVADFAGQYVKTADKGIIRHLKEKKRLIVDSQLIHSYPFCWRYALTFSYPILEQLRITTSCPPLTAFSLLLILVSVLTLRCSTKPSHPGSSR